MGYYYIDQATGKPKWHSEIGDEEQYEDFALHLGRIIGVGIIMAMLVWLLSGCTTTRQMQKSVSVKKDSIAQVDSTVKSTIISDTARKERYVFEKDSLATFVTDSTILSSDKETVITITVDSTGKEIGRNTVTTITNNRDHWRNTNTDRTNTSTDKQTDIQKHNEAHDAFDYHFGYHNIVDSINNESEKVVEKKQTLWQKWHGFCDMLGYIIVLCIVVLGGRFVYKHIYG